MIEFWLAHDYQQVRARLLSWRARAPWIGLASGLPFCNATTTFPTYLLNVLGLAALTIAFWRRDRRGIDQCTAFYRRYKTDGRVRLIFWVLFGRFTAGMYFVGFGAEAAAHSGPLGLDWSLLPICVAMLALSWWAERRVAPIFNKSE